MRALDGSEKIRRADLVQKLQALGYSEGEAEDMLKKLHAAGIVKSTTGRYSDVYIS